MRAFVRRCLENILFQLPDSVQEGLTRYGLFLLHWIGLRRVPVVLLQGAARQTGAPGKLLIVGEERWMQYPIQRFFMDKPTSESLGHVAVRALPQYLDNVQIQADMMLVRIDRLSGRKLFDHRYLAVPEWVGTKLEVPEDLNEVVRSGGSIHRDMTLVRRHGYEPRCTFGAEDFDDFYSSIYLPFAVGRHGDSAIVRQAGDLRRRVRHGGILWLQQGGRRVAAVLFERKGRSLDLLALGTLNGDLQLVKEGAIAALYFFSIELAGKLGYQTVDFRGSRPSLMDGLLRYKSKWGVSLYDKTDSHHDWYLRWSEANEVVQEFFSHTPLIFRESQAFSALLGNKVQPEQGIWVKRLERWYRLTPSGMRSLPEPKGNRPARDAFANEERKVFAK
jgi:hypothetical protein